ncbi:MAG: hypothetical protein P4L84_29370 [Isosphaeraceae bacterium]|nr:hypothetical protein [Isosphaeraceae bacterium]
MIPVGRILRARRVSGVISTDDILPARSKYVSVAPSEMARHLFENLAPPLSGPLQPGDVLVGDDLMGVGSSREQAVSALLAAGVEAVLAPAFGRIFFRNAWNLGLVALEVRDFGAADGDPLEIDLAGAVIRHAGRALPFRPVPPEMIEIAHEGGLLARLRKSLGVG